MRLTSTVPATTRPVARQENIAAILASKNVGTAGQDASRFHCHEGVKRPGHEHKGQTTIGVKCHFGLEVRRSVVEVAGRSLMIPNQRSFEFRGGVPQVPLLKG